MFVFGGYTVAEDGSERSLPHVDVYDPRSGRWSRGAPMPIPVEIVLLACRSAFKNANTIADFDLAALNDVGKHSALLD